MLAFCVRSNRANKAKTKGEKREKFFPSSILLHDRRRCSYIPAASIFVSRLIHEAVIINSELFSKAVSIFNNNSNKNPLVKVLWPWLEEVLCFQSFERLLALEEVLRWLEEVLKRLEEVLNLPRDFSYFLLVPANYISKL